MSNFMNWTKVIFRTTLYCFYIIILVTIMLEVIFRVLPTSSPIEFQPISSEVEILRFYPNQETTFALGANFYKVTKKSTNNYGFYSSYDYFAKSKPDILIIGDSFVEATQISNKDTIGEILQFENPGLTVYQLGVPGVPLSQFIQMIRYGKKEFLPQHYAVIVTGNDFDESLCSYRKKDGTWCFSDDYELTFVPFHGYSKVRKIAKKSAFLRYLVFHISLDWRNIAAKFNAFNTGITVAPEFAANTERFKSKETVDASRSVVDQFFKELEELNLSKNITIIIDADRDDIYRNVQSISFFNELRTYLIDSARLHGVSYVDMDPIFREDFLAFGEAFNFPTDGHWNERAHRLASQQLFKEYYRLNK